MLKLATGVLLGGLLSIIGLCIVYSSKISWDGGFGFSDILGICSAIIIGFYMPWKLSQALNNKKDKKQYLLDAISDIELQITLFIEIVEDNCCNQDKATLNKEITVSVLLHKMEILGNKLVRTRSMNKKISILEQDMFDQLYKNFLEFRSVLDNTRNTDFSFNYDYLRSVFTEAEIKLISKLQHIKGELLNRI